MYCSRPESNKAARTVICADLREEVDQQDDEQKCENTTTDIHRTPPIVRLTRRQYRSL